MKKTNFTKVEKALEEGLIKITSKQLLDQAGAKSPAKQLKEPVLGLPPKEVSLTVMQNIYKELKKMHKEDESAYKQMGFHRQNLKKLIENPHLLTPADWNKIKKVQDRIDLYKKELALMLPFQSDEELIEQQRIKSPNKRFNVNDKWLPLH
jgi:hypothetical protein